MTFNNSILPFTADYRKKCFDAWVLAGRPSETTRIRDLVPEDEWGRRPSSAVIGRWMDIYNWQQLGDEIDTQAIEIANKALIQTKAEMFKKQYENAVEIQDIALKNIKEKGFDNSNAAVNAYFKATQEARTVMGISEFMEKIGKMSEKQLQDEIAERLERMNVVDAIPVDEEANVIEQKENKADNEENMSADT